MRLHHLAFRVGDLAASVAYYRDLLGLDPVRDNRPRSVWLGLDGGALLMLETRARDEPALDAGAMDLTAFRVSPSTRQALRQRAVDTGCFDGETEHTVYVRDPDGRRIGLSSYELGDDGTTASGR